MIVITTTLLDLELTGSNNTSACNHVFLPLLCYFLFFLSLFSFLFFSHLLLSFTLGLILLLLCSFPPFPPIFFSLLSFISFLFSFFLPPLSSYSLFLLCSPLPLFSISFFLHLLSLLLLLLLHSSHYNNFFKNTLSAEILPHVMA